MSDSLPPLLITASLDVGKTPLVALRDTRSRTLNHMEGLLSWLNDPVISRIVFVKNCGAKIHPEVLQEVAAAHGKELEFVQTASSPRTIVQGKGYGEGDMIAQALERSEILRCGDAFLKITGKLYAPKVDEVFTGAGEGEFFVSCQQPLAPHKGIRELLSPFYRSERENAALAVLRRYCRIPWGLMAAIPRGWIDTRCYRVNCEFYKSIMIRSHVRVQDALGYTLENAVFDDLYEQKNLRLIQDDPMIIGTSGTMGSSAGRFSSEISAAAQELTQRLIS